MAKTETLLDLISEFGEAFADPDFAADLPKSAEAVEPDEEGKTGETEQLPEDESDSDMSWCYHCLAQLEYEPELLQIATTFLTQLADLATRKKHFANEPLRQQLQKLADEGALDKVFASESKASVNPALVDLPETYARQSSGDCISGVCPIDH